ncbi:motility associated factor glycosyltransferase family protein [Aneurinibacillus migulanus]|uniref:Uncharacterized conserved protein n=1 Tax=Aneurinibacillus migulanus TaxID=47500 RepID=A0A0M0GYQ0_ANEMI|nr:6-hydroxymethylpterin diphosphokinase MptE-like protein [Aneurinibacillus migulanus]KON94607.1 hypothetical protein AF333_02975 [Aneurinibacillus migulanus]MED0892655.1 DUF115 domain-containing protein [Aneurinibacillus migulanus]MED1614296.1 DUF115 domain-containing protein [Aneurinibacillus migulanus]SDI47821.1 Uncharacterized conserved protein [Aneurinibacillus migulanus]GED14544.1 hypothetical protein AMI01nite_25350 [Aneurinibacillus migulanus]
MNVWLHNIELLRIHYPDIYTRVKDMPLLNGYEILSSREGHPTAKIGSFYLHSRYNPIQEAKKFIEAQWNEDEQEIALYGLGFGYHIVEALERIQPEQTLYVFELNIQLFSLVLRNMDIEYILTHPQLRLIVSDNQAHVARCLHERLLQTNRLIIYPPSVRTIPERYDRLKFLLEFWDKRLLQVKNYAPLLQENSEANLKHRDRNVSEFFGKYKDKPIIVISAGPSLNKNKHLLAQCKGKALLFAAGSALKPLLATGIQPDMFCIIDAIHRTTRKQIEGLEGMDIPFVYLKTASAVTVEAYHGPRFVASNRSEDDGAIETGGSVATAILDIATRMGGNPIIFVGQDLAFTNNEHHADGSMYGEEEKVKINPTMKQVRGQNGETLWTNIGLLSYKYWIEERIQREPNVTFINATEGGAYIEGCIHIPLYEVIKKYINKST